jgi:cytochrome c-type biogenesis protein CcmH/NrfG
MFTLKKPAQTDDQIPYSVYQTAQYGNSRHYRWIYELVVAAAIVVILALGAVWAYREVHAKKTPTPTQSANVTQSPQTASPATQSTGTPSATRAAKSTNKASLPQPKN